MSDPPRLWLDGLRDEELGPLEPGRRALARDPFDEPEGSDPFLEAVEALEGLGTRAVEAAGGVPCPRPRGETSAPDPEPRSRLPRLTEVPPPAPESLLERLVGEDGLRRVAALAHLADSESGYDRYGLSPRTVRTALPFFLALYRGWFRVQSRGHEHLPAEGGAVLACNHGGLLPFDGAMAAIDVLLHTDPPRLVRSVVDRWAGALPWVNVFFARVGQVIGTRSNVSDLLASGQLVLVFPEGMDGIRKRVTQRYRLQRFRVGFVEEALRARVPVVPMAVVGSDDQAPILYDAKPLARLLGLPVAPVTPTFPWLGPLGLLPYPVSYRIVYGEPLPFHERHGPEAADDPRVVRYLASRVRREIQALLDRNR